MIRVIMNDPLQLSAQEHPHTIQLSPSVHHIVFALAVRINGKKSLFSEFKELVLEEPVHLFPLHTRWNKPDMT